MRSMNVSVCRPCIDKNHQQPPCVPAHHKAINLPCIRVIPVSDAGQPCFFHADWQELAPMLLHGRYEPYDTLSRTTLTIMAEHLKKYVGTDAPNSALTPSAAQDVGYQKYGDRVLQWGRYLIIRAIPRDSAYNRFLAACNLHITTAGADPQFLLSRWRVAGSAGAGGGGKLGIGGGTLTLESPGGAQYNYKFGGVGPSWGLPKLPALTKSVSGSKASYFSKGFIMKNPLVYGFDEIRDAADFNGPVVWGDASIAAIGGFSGTVMIVGGPVFRAVIPIAGIISGITGSASVYAGYLRG